ncbi:MAG: methylmalonyl-CoA mutase family protein [Anaerolineales bacterium]
MAFESEYERWEKENLKPTLKRFPERKPVFITSSGIPLPPVALPVHPDPDYMDQLGFPGEYPFTRGVQPSMYRGRFWTMRQYAGYATAEDSNRRYRYLLEQGQTGLSVAFDLPTQIGFDSDDPFAVGEVGKVGVSISSLQDMEILFRGIPLDKVSTSMTINAPASILLAMYIALAKRQGVEAHQLRGTIQNDILKEYIARGTYIFPPKPSMRLITDIFSFCQREVPHWNTISISGYHIREAGATAVQEVAFTLANAIAYVQAALSSVKYPGQLRRVVVWDEKNNREIELLTNHLTFGATTISKIYRDRWEIELFFKVLKQHLKIKTFVGTTPNALRTQIWTALITILLIKYLQFRSKCNLPLCRLVALLRLNLFSYRNLWDWLDDPFETPPKEPELQCQLVF